MNNGANNMVPTLNNLQNQQQPLNITSSISLPFPVTNNNISNLQNSNSSMPDFINNVSNSVNSNNSFNNSTLSSADQTSISNTNIQGNTLLNSIPSSVQNQKMIQRSFLEKRNQVSNFY